MALVRLVRLDIWYGARSPSILLRWAAVSVYVGTRSRLAPTSKRSDTDGSVTAPRFTPPTTDPCLGRQTGDPSVHPVLRIPSVSGTTPAVLLISSKFRARRPVAYAIASQSRGKGGTVRRPQAIEHDDDCGAAAPQLQI